MRVNIDSQVVTDPRFKRLARYASLSSWYDALGRSIPIWLECYSRRTAVLSLLDLDIVSEHDGFGAAMTAADLAEDLGDGNVRVRGVRERITFLEQQDAKSRLAVEARKRTSTVTSGDSPSEAQRDALGARLNGDGPRGLPIRNGHNKHEPAGQPDGSPPGQPDGSPYSPDLDLAPDPDLRSERESAPAAARAGARARSPARTTQPSAAPLSLISIDWRPSRDPETVALENANAANGMPISTALANFRDDMVSKGRRSADWTAEWRKWLRRERPARPPAASSALAVVAAKPKPTPRTASPIVLARSPNELAELSGMVRGALASLSVRSEPPDDVVRIGGERSFDPDEIDDHGDAEGS